MRIALCFILLFSISLMFAATGANSSRDRIINTWTGVTSTAWGTTTNWSQEHVPTAAEDVIIPAGAPRYPTIAAGARFCNNLGIAGGSLTLSGGSLTVSTSLGVGTGTSLSVTGGTLTVQTDLGVESGASATFSGGTVNVDNECQVNGTLNVNTAGTVADLNYCTVSGTLSLAGANLNIIYDLTISGHLNISNNSSDLYVYDDLIFLSGAQTNTTDSANIHIRGNLETYAGSNVNLALNTITFFSIGESAIVTNAAATVNNLTFAKLPPGSTVYHSNSTADLTVTGNLTLADGNTFSQSYAGTLHLHGNLNTAATADFHFDAGALSLEGMSSTQVNGITSTNRFKDVVIAKAGLALTVDFAGAAEAEIYIQGNLTINSGVFQPLTHIRFYGNWTNNVGPDGFIESEFVLTAMGDANQTILGTDNLYYLNLEKTGGYLYFPAGSDITCGYFRQNGGGIRVNGGTLRSNFTFSYMEGTAIVDSGLLELRWENSNPMDLKGTLNISGGLVKLIGGSQNFQLANYSGNQFTMSGGVLDVINKGISFSCTNPSLPFTCNVSGGTIRTGHDFTCVRTDFHPTGGTLELYGAENSLLQTASGSWLHHLTINKDAVEFSWALINSDITVKGDIFISEGELFGSDSNIYLTGNFNFGLGVQGFYPETSTVYAVGSSGIQYINVTRLHNLVDNNTGGGIVSNMYVEITGTLTVNRLVSLNSNSAINNVINSVPTATLNMGYPSSIAYYASGGTLNIPSICNLVISDLSDAGLTGNINVNAGTLDITQDSSDLRLDGNLTITNNGTVHLKTAGGYVGLFKMGEISPASLSMDSGSLNLHCLSMVIDGPLVRSNEFNLTGGTIRCSGSWFDYAGTFDPTGGTVEFFDSPYAAVPQSSQVVLLGNSWFNNLTASKSVGEVSLNSCKIKGNVTVSGTNLLQLVGGNTSIINGGDISINAGILDLNGFTLNHSGNIYVNGELRMNGTSTLKMANGMSLVVNNGGKLTCLGDETNHPLLTHNETGYYNCSLESGSTLSAQYAIFEYMGTNGIQIKPGAWVDTSYNLDHCTFRIPITSGKLLTVNNSQTFTVTGAHFPGTEFYGGNYTVYKNLGTGTVTFHNAKGVVAGPYFELDPTNRINWDWDGELIKLQISRNLMGLVTLNWNNTLEAVWYRIFRSSELEGPYTQVGEVSGNITQEWSEYPPAGTKFFYYVKAVWMPY